VSLWKRNLHKNKNYVNNPQTVFQKYLKKTLIFGDVDKVYKDDVYNAILLNIKYYIYTNRCLKKNFSFHSLKACLINLYKTEKMIAVRNQRIAEFQYQEFTCPSRFCTFSQPQKMCSMVSFSVWQKLQFASSIILLVLYDKC
jgi:hypothetical protein